MSPSPQDPAGSPGGLVMAMAMAAVLAVGIGIGAWGTRAVRPAIAPPPIETTAAALAAPSGAGWQAWGTRPDGTPLRWNPCEPVEWVVRPTDPPWLVDVADRALREVGVAAGLDFRHAGTSDAPVGTDASTMADAGWAPVVVTFSTPTEVDWLTIDDRAVAVPVEVDDVFVTGQVLLNGDVDLATDFSSRDGSWGATLLHEAAHLAGLDHVDDPDQLLHPVPRPGAAALAAGDRRGLASLRANGTCLPTTPVDVDVPTPRRRSLHVRPSR